jgi:TetR/AcrR family transcriptional regulator
MVWLCSRDMGVSDTSVVRGAAVVAGPGQRRRRSADPDRRRDPEGNRRAILDAAREEFGRHGFAGARVVRIAAAAGVSHQSITYHFGGKQGLFDALEEHWQKSSVEMIGGSEPYAELIRTYVHEAYRERAWAQVLVREELDGAPPVSVERVADFVEQTRQRQATGEIRDDLDAGALTLAVFAASIAPVILPNLTRKFTGADPSSDVFVDHYADQLARIMSALARTPPPVTGPAPGPATAPGTSRV